MLEKSQQNNTKTTSNKLVLLKPKYSKESEIYFDKLAQAFVDSLKKEAK